MSQTGQTFRCVRCDRGVVFPWLVGRLGGGGCCGRLRAGIGLDRGGEQHRPNLGDALGSVCCGEFDAAHEHVDPRFGQLLLAEYCEIGRPVSRTVDTKLLQFQSHGGIDRVVVGAGVGREEAEHGHCPAVEVACRTHLCGAIRDDKFRGREAGGKGHRRHSALAELVHMPRGAEVDEHGRTGGPDDDV